jgi:hypothetical protein
MATRRFIVVENMVCCCPFDRVVSVPATADVVSVASRSDVGFAAG